MTEIFYGDFGTGKTTQLIEKIKNTARLKERCILFVPEQFSFDSERAIYFAVGAKYCRFVKVTGFSKLSREILKQYNKANPCADEAVKLITMWKIVERLRKSFIGFNKEKNSSGFCRLMLKTVSAFRNADISPKDYRSYLTNETSFDDELMNKAEDFLEIYTEYDKEIKERLKLDDKLDDVSRAAALAQEHNFFKGAHIFFDNYDSFSASQQKLLKAALIQSESSYFCFSCDSPESKKREFLCINKTLKELSAIVPDIIYRPFKEPYRALKRDNASVKIFRAKTPYDEADIAAAEINRLVREEGLRYRDILVLAGDSEYESVLSRRFSDSGIPVFCDFPKPMTDKPIVRFVLQLLRATDGDNEELLRLAESGFKRIFCDGERRLLFSSEVYRLRAAAEAYGVLSEDFIIDQGDEKKNGLSELYNLKIALTEPILKLRAHLEASKDGYEFSEIFMNYLTDVEGITASLIALSKTGEGGETDDIKLDEAAAEENKRLWDALCEAFTSMAYCLEGVKIGIDEYRLLLEEILMEINLANPPQVLDSVTIGDIERTRKAAPKAVIIVGANEGAIPAKSEIKSIFTHLEREQLNKAGIRLYDALVHRLSKEYYFALRAMALYEKKLIITFSSGDFSGKERDKAEILKTLKTDVINAETLSPEYFLNTAYDLKKFAAKSYGTKDSLFEELFSLINKSDFKESLNNASALLSGKRDLNIEPKTADKLFYINEYSPTKLETAFKCSFMYFCKYGLGLKEYSDNDINSPAAKGSAVHNIMRIALENNKAIVEKSDEEIEAIALKSILSAACEAIAENPVFPERTRNIYLSLFYRIVMLLKQTALDLKTTGFIPKYFEKKIGYAIKDDVEGGKEILIKGIADRIDIMNVGDAGLIRICDYKTGTKGKDFTASDIENGTSLQTLLYLFAECESEERVRPGAVEYFEAKSPSALSVIGINEPEQTEMNQKWFSEHKLSGAIFDGGETQRAIESYEDAVRKITKTTSRSTFVKSLFFSEDKLELLKEHISRDIILPKIKELSSGKIEALPLETNDALPCDFCEFGGICGNNKGKNTKSPKNSNLLDQFISQKKEP